MVWRDMTRLVVDSTADLSVSYHVNDTLRQKVGPVRWILGVSEFVSYLSQFTTLLPGDVLFTGSPGDSGPLVAGDVVSIEVEGVGPVQHTVVAAHQGTEDRRFTS